MILSAALTATVAPRSVIVRTATTVVVSGQARAGVEPV
ncbi:MAG: hypothetical protein JWN79_518 [Gemmatimonadetes bacterium]|jgi:hypothetical protein|nr:hypothetical protein [Gemmatimonadota bacterium]